MTITTQAADPALALAAQAADPIPAADGGPVPDDRTTQAIGLARGYELNPRSGMISLDLPPGTIAPVPDGVSDHHITVVYLGPDVDDEAFAQACDRAQKAAAAMPGPLAGTVGGIGTFPPSGGSDGKTPAWAGVVLPGAERIRSALEDLSASEHKDWKPHVTLAYVEPGEALPAPVPQTQVMLTHLSVHRGDDEVARFPLGGGPAVMAGIAGQAADPETISGQVTALAAETAKVSMDVTGPPDQVARFAQLCRTIQVLCEVGASRTVQVDVDGDGNASLSFTFGSLDAADVKPASFDSDPVRIPGIGG